MHRRDFTKHTLALAAATCGFTAHAATNWPTKPVRLVIAHPAGSGVDAIARVTGERLSAMWGQAVVVDNKPGGQNTIGASNVAHSPADGYTLYLATTAALVTNTYLFKELPYDPRKDFAPICFVGFSPFSLAVKQNSGIKTFQEFIARAKEKAGMVTVATEGPKSFGGMTARLLNAKAKIDTNLVSYASSGVALQDLMGGQVEAIITDLATLAPLVKQGSLRVIAMTTEKRVPGWDVPTVSESIPGFDMIGWFGYVAPTGTPADILARVNQDLNVVLKEPAVLDKLGLLGLQIAGGSADDMGRFMSGEQRRWGDISREIGLTPE